jgi:hypothetical protein
MNVRIRILGVQKSVEEKMVPWFLGLGLLE